MFTVSEDVNPLTTNINKVEQNITSSGTVGENSKPKRRSFFISRKNVFTDGVKDEELLSLYVGKNYRKISSRILNIAALIFCPFYYLYRKMFLFGILIFVGLLFIHLHFENYFIDAAYYFVFGLIFNILYFSKVRRRVARIASQNINLDAYNVGRICSKKGGTSFIILLLGILIDLIILIFSKQKKKMEIV